jgi:CRISPR-associated protein Csx16
MTRRLITFLGPTDYRILTYALPGGNSRVETCFVARALAELMDCTEVIVMATDTAWQANGERLTTALAQINLAPTRCPIPDGKNETELRAQFRALTEALAGAENPVLDITHGFRAQPFFAATALATMAASGDLPDDTRIAYGAMEATENGLTPIWDLTPFLMMQMVAQGVAMLKHTGHGGPLAEALERERRHLALRRNRGEREDFSRSEALKKAIEAFTGDLATLRLPALTIGPEGRPSSAQVLLQALEKYSKTCAQDHPALVPLLNDLAEMAHPLPARTLFGEEGQKALAALGRLYLNFNRPLEAAAVAREGFVGLFANSPAETDAGRAGFDKTARHAAERRAMATDTGRTIADTRNDLLHAAMRTAPQPAGPLLDNAQKAIDRFADTAPHPPTENPKGRTLFVTRHKGAVEWARRQGITAEAVTHLNVKDINPDDTVIGTLPVHLVAEICACGGRYRHLVLNLPPEARGRELSAGDMERFGAELVEYEARKVHR